MSGLYVADARYPLWRNLVAPVFVADQLIVIGILAGLCSFLAAVANDPTMFLFLVVLAYGAYVLSMQRFVPYEVRIAAVDLAHVVDLLDKTRVIARDGDRWLWSRKSPLPKWFTSHLDQISIAETNDGYRVFGRKDDMRTLASALNKRTAR